jgi:UDP-glucuronate decarboxylase
VSNFIVQALRGEPVAIYGQGSQTRSFCYVDDLVEALVRLMASGEQFTGPVNLGNPGELTILALARMVLELTGSNSELVYKPLPQDDPMQRKPDIRLAQRELAWQPTVPIDAGLRRTIDYFRSRSEVAAARPVRRRSIAAASSSASR